MLSQVLTYLPKLLTAIALLGLAYVAGRYAAIDYRYLTGLGFNHIFQALGLSQFSSIASEDTKQPNLTLTPAEITGILALVAIMLIATITAVDILQLAALETLLQSI
ncbi:MAG: hypothetical protein QNJ53_23420 [Pleurocapsa sp. MO_192.B19]|nr:hypothetical protein [Pleurocapsa sp. MO_192.B19]